MAEQRPNTQKLPAGLATVLNAPEEHRDSAYYSSTDASSKHNSTASNNINIYYHAAQDKTPSPTTTTTTVPQSLVSPPSNMSVASMVSPTSPGSMRFDRPLSLDSSSVLSGAPSLAPDSRRESVDSRINQGFGDLRLGGSPYASANQSTTSIHASLATQRNPRGGFEHLSMNRISNGYQPSVERTPDGHPKARTAPAITGPATSSIARAAEPTKGEAWAFPEDEIQRVPPGISSGTFLDSRRSSVAESIASSQFTADSRLPPGQRRLEDVVPPEFSRLSNNSTDFQTHHHSLQHKQLSDLQSEESSPHNGSQPYSRTPELRVSHKLAERKRRTEMKELFDQLRDLMPQERGSKASKWEILSKAITEHQRLSDQFKQLTVHYQTAMAEKEMMSREVDRLRAEISQMRNGPGAGSGAITQPPPVPQHPSEAYGQDPYGRAPRPELPPLRNLSNNLPNGPESMTGVQYDGQRPHSFRQDRF